MFQAECHCGSVRTSTIELPDSATSCNCSICHRLGAIWAYYDAEDVKILVQDTPVSTYSWGEKSIEFHFCCNCGCATHYSATEDNGREMVAINIRMAPTSVTDSIPLRYFDGAVSWEYIED